MKIVYFYQYFNTPKGSFSTRVYEYGRRWARDGDDVTVVTGVYDKSDLRPDGRLSRLRIDGIDVRVINIAISNKHSYVRRIATFIGYAAMTAWYALVLPADVVVCSSGPLSIGVPGLVARYLRRRPLVMEFRDLWLEGAIQLGMIRNRTVISLARWFERTCCRAATEVVALSEGIAAGIREQYGVERVHVIPNGSDTSLFSRPRSESAPLPGWTAGKQLVVYAGTLGLIDDCAQIVSMAAHLQRWSTPDIAVVLIGDGKERAALEQQARELGLSNLHFVGQIPKTDVVPWLQQSSCALFVCKDTPFLNTASPNKLFDAFAAGAAVVQTTTGWIHRLCEREECGLNTPPGDPEALARSVLRVVREPELNARLRAGARRAAHTLFHRDHLAAQMRAVIASAAVSRAGRASTNASAQNPNDASVLSSVAGKTRSRLD